MPGQPVRYAVSFDNGGAAGNHVVPKVFQGFYTNPTWSESVKNRLQGKIHTHDQGARLPHVENLDGGSCCRGGKNRRRQHRRRETELSRPAGELPPLMNSENDSFRILHAFAIEMGCAILACD